jgi:hypothetical protein
MAANFAHIPNSDAESMQPVYFIASCVITVTEALKAAIVPENAIILYLGRSTDSRMRIAEFIEFKTLKSTRRRRGASTPSKTFQTFELTGMIHLSIFP